MASSKTERFNVLLPSALWRRLITAADSVGCSRPQFIRLVLDAAAANPAIYVPPKAQKGPEHAWAMAGGRQPVYGAPEPVMSRRPAERPYFAPPQTVESEPVVRRPQFMPPAAEPKRAQPTAPALPPREQWGAIRVCVKCFANSPQTWENCVECGAVLPPPLPDEPEVEEEHEPIVYEPDVYYAHWLKVGRTKEDAYNMVKMACRDEGIDWEPRVEEVDSASGPQ